MPRTAYSFLRSASGTLTSINGGGVNYVVQAQNGSWYSITSNSWGDLEYMKSTNRGLTWEPPVSVFAGTLTAIAVWFDRWTPGLTTDLIHIVYVESATDTTFYRTINTASSDALSTQTSVFVGATTATGGHLSVTRSRGGNVYCKTVIDAGVEGGFYRLPNANVPAGAWDAVRTINETLATDDQVILMPGFAADNQDIILLHWDASADEVSRQLYDDSANTWSETSIAASMTDIVRTTSGPHYAACCHTTDSEVLMAAWSNVDTLNADLRFWTITDSTITEGTEVVLNSTDDQGACAVGYDSTTNEIYVFYCGKSDGSETWYSAVNVYYKVSGDGGTTWGAETQLTPSARGIVSIWCCPRTVSGPPVVVFLEYNGSSQGGYGCAGPVVQPRAQAMIVM